MGERNAHREEVGQQEGGGGGATCRTTGRMRAGERGSQRGGNEEKERRWLGGAKHWEARREGGNPRRVGIQGDSREGEGVQP